MIYESLIAPSEFPILERDVKRALLTYDKVKLIDPSDRDVMPSNTFMSTIIGIPLMGIDTGPIRPMGKTIGYDNSFDKLISDLLPAVKQGLVETISTYDQSETKQATIGAVLTGGYPLNTQFVFWLYRNMAQNQDFLKSAIEFDISALLKLFDSEKDIALKGGGDGGINNIPALPKIELEQLNDETSEYITVIARSRIASFIKYAGYCEQKNLIPLFPSDIYGQIASRLLNNTRSVLEELDDDKFWLKRNRVLSLCHEEYLVDAILDNISIKDVINFRTKIWDKQARAREELFNSIGVLSSEIENEIDFNKAAQLKVQEYRKTASELELERKNLKFRIKCDIGTGLFGGSAGMTGLLSQLESPISSIALTLAAGGIWALEKSKEYVPALRELRKQEEELKRGAGFGIQNFYTRLK